MKKAGYIIVILGTALVLSGCKKNTGTTGNPDADLAALTVEFDHIVGGQNLILNNVNYINAAGEMYTIERVQYFISNIQLAKADGSAYTVNQDSSYFLINEADAASRLAKVKIPEGDYTTLSFVLGVDSLRNTMDISKRTGVLDPAAGNDDGMYWGWNSGYIFFKMEGTSPQAPADPTGVRKYRYHIGGFGGYSSTTINNIKTIKINLVNKGIAKVRKQRNANIHLMVDLDKVFSGTTLISIATHPTVMFSDYSVNIANNYTAMFLHDHTEN